MLIPPPTLRNSRQAANESVHRTMNELREAGAAPSATLMSCECECYRSECGASFQIAIDDYETVRSEGRQFVVVCGHQTPDEEIITPTGAYLVIAKTGTQGRIAEVLDPR